MKYKCLKKSPRSSGTQLPFLFRPHSAPMCWMRSLTLTEATSIQIHLRHLLCSSSTQVLPSEVSPSLPFSMKPARSTQASSEPFLLCSLVLVMESYTSIHIKLYCCIFSPIFLLASSPYFFPPF